LIRIPVALIVGSNRRDSINLQLARALAALAPDSLEIRQVRIDDLPMYNADHDPEGIAEVRRFKEELGRCGAVLIVTPEHNRSLPAVLKNAIDWGSKPAPSQVWRDKVVAITGTTPGAIGTAIAQQHLRQILGDLGSLVMGGEAYIQFKPGFLTDDGKIADATTRDFLGAYVERFATLAQKLQRA